MKGVKTKMLHKSGITLLLLLALFASVAPARADATSYRLAVLPPEHKLMKDPITGVDLLFVSASSAKDHNLYFHQRSWISDDSMVLFRSDRPGGKLMGYLFATGELVCLTTPAGALLCPTAAWEGNRVYAYRPPDIVEIALTIEPSADVTKAPSTVTATERVICTLPAGTGLNAGLTENRDGTLLGLDLSRPDGQWVAVADVRSGEVRYVCQFTFAGHLQFSITNPNLMSVAGTKDRLVVIDLSQGGQPRILHHQVEGEFVTHECWWINDSLTFCGGYRDKESHVKVIDVHTGEVRIVGAGAWVPWAESGDDVLNRWNWWHAAGHESGRWIVADNWYGDVVVFDGETTQMHRLTLGHRRYGGGLHPEPGWDRSGRRVVFTSEMLGGSHVCVATIPDEWRPDPADEGPLLTGGSAASPPTDKPSE